MRRRPCPGSGTLAPLPLDSGNQWCPVCGHNYGAGDDGCIRRHPMRYASMLRHLGEIVWHDRVSNHGGMWPSGSYR